MLYHIMVLSITFHICFTFWCDSVVFESTLVFWKVVKIRTLPKSDSLQQQKNHFWLGVPFLLILGRLVLVLVLVALSYGFQYAVENTSNIWAPAFEVAFSLGFLERRVGKIAKYKNTKYELTDMKIPKYNDKNTVQK